MAPNPNIVALQAAERLLREHDARIAEAAAEVKRLRAERKDLADRASATLEAGGPDPVRRGAAVTAQDREDLRTQAAARASAGCRISYLILDLLGELEAKEAEAVERLAPPPRDERTWIQTYTSRQVWPLNPVPEDICIEDIAHALSNLCRYTGHTRWPYSVAQHSVLAADHCPDAARWALMHDAAEAYLADVARPVKRFLGGYKEAEERLERVIAERFGLEWPMPECVKVIDIRLLATERRDLMSRPPIPWVSTRDVEPLPDRIHPWPPSVAESRFLERFRELFPEVPE